MKCLVLGCSFSSGSYMLNPEWAGADDDWKNEIWQEILETRTGWYSYVDTLKAYDTTVIATPAQGYVTWAQILHGLEVTDKIKNYQKIIIQETVEPRITFFQDKHIEELILTNFVKCREIVDNISHIILNPRDMWDADFQKPKTHYGQLPVFNLHYHAVRRMFRDYPDNKNKETFLDKYLTGFTFGWMGNQIAQWASDYVQDICKKYNITGYVWSFKQPIMDCKHLTRIKSKLWLHDLSTHNELTWHNNEFDYGHQITAGNKRIAEYLNEKMSNIRM